MRHLGVRAQYYNLCYSIYSPPEKYPRYAIIKKDWGIADLARLNLINWATKISSPRPLGCLHLN